MAEIIGGEFKRNETNQQSMGGTEMLTMKLAERADPELLKECQIVSSRVRELDDDKVRIFWAHDLPGDPESEFLKTQHGKDKFHKFVFVSNYQMQEYIKRYDLPWSKCTVLRNFIDPIPEHKKPDDGKINIIYHTTPHRGLNILTAIYERLSQKWGDKIHLDVYSSFGVYGWNERDKDFKELFDKIDSMPNATNHGAKSNAEVRTALENAHIFCYPSTWVETSCLSLIEAMSAGLMCVHSNLGCLYETASHWTNMYQYNENINNHAGACFNMLDLTIEHYNDMKANAGPTKVYADAFYSWDNRKTEWNSLLKALVSSIEDRSIPVDRGEMFTYKTA